MKKIFIILCLITTLFIPSLSPAIETAPRISDREIVERLTRLETKLEEGQKIFKSEMNTLRTEIRANAGAIKQLREDINIQFDRIVGIMKTIVIAFAGIFGITISFAIWDRRTMIRPFEEKVKKVEGEIAKNRSKLHSLLDALRTLSKTDTKVADVLRSFNLL